MGIFLDFENYILRKFVDEDYQLIKDLDSNPEVMRFLTNGQPSSDCEVRRAMGIFLSWQKKFDGKYGYWVVIEKSSHEFVGWFHLRPLKEDPENLRILELGYRLKQEFWGKGIATGISKKLIEKGFKEYNAEEIWAITMKKNIASRRVMEKCGLKLFKESIYEPFPSDDKECVYYKLTKN